LPSRGPPGSSELFAYRLAPRLKRVLVRAIVTLAHSRSKNGVVSLTYVAGIHVSIGNRRKA
jgi:hypothetical protein